MKELIIIGLTIIIIIISIGYFLNENTKINKDFQIKCMEKGGIISLTPGKYSEVFCNAK